MSHRSGMARSKNLRCEDASRIREDNGFSRIAGNMNAAPTAAHGNLSVFAGPSGMRKYGVGANPLSPEVFLFEVETIEELEAPKIASRAFKGTSDLLLSFNIDEAAESEGDHRDGRWYECLPQTTYPAYCAGVAADAARSEAACKRLWGHLSSS